MCSCVRVGAARWLSGGLSCARSTFARLADELVFEHTLRLRTPLARGAVVAGLARLSPGNGHTMMERFARRSTLCAAVQARANAHTNSQTDAQTYGGKLARRVYGWTLAGDSQSRRSSSQSARAGLDLDWARSLMRASARELIAISSLLLRSNQESRSDSEKVSTSDGRAALLRCARRRAARTKTSAASALSARARH